jgi:hypothetical protein
VGALLSILGLGVGVWAALRRERLKVQVAGRKNCRRATGSYGGNRTHVGAAEQHTRTLTFSLRRSA